MWHAFGEFLLKLHAQGLGHEAVIEIMVALLGLMITVLSVLAGLVGLFGYVAIRREAKKTAAKVARDTTAELVAAEFKKQQAISLSLNQPPSRAKRAKPPAKPGRKTTDASLTRGNTK